MKRDRTLMGRGKVDWIGAKPLWRRLVLALGVLDRVVEVLPVHPHAALKIVHRSRIGDLNLRMPHERHVAHDAPHNDRQHERQAPEHKPRMRRDRPEHLEPSSFHPGSPPRVVRYLRYCASVSDGSM